MRYLALALAFVSLVACGRPPFSDTRSARWIRADVREALEAYQASEHEHLSHNYDLAYIARGRDMTCDGHWLPAFSFECPIFPHN